jgi:hypothetical protein
VDRFSDEPEDGGEVARAGDGGGSGDRSKGATLDGSDRAGGGDGRRVPATTPLPPDERLPALQPSIPHLTRSAVNPGEELVSGIGRMSWPSRSRILHLSPEATS